MWGHACHGVPVEVRGQNGEMIYLLGIVLRSSGLEARALTFLIISSALTAQFKWMGKTEAVFILSNFNLGLMEDNSHAK